VRSRWLLLAPRQESGSPSPQPSSDVGAAGLPASVLKKRWSRYLLREKTQVLRLPHPASQGGGLGGRGRGKLRACGR